MNRSFRTYLSFPCSELWCLHHFYQSSSSATWTVAKTLRVCLWAEEGIVSSKIMRAVEDRPEELTMSFGDQILQYVTDETKLRAPLESVAG